MGEFVKYQHVEKLDSRECEDILLGTVHVFYKIDGTNGSVWLDDNGALACGSRNRVLSLDDDNAGFCAWVNQNRDKFYEFLGDNPGATLYGEWLVPHTIKNYRDEAWRDFYVFDVMVDGKHIPYSLYKPSLDEHRINYIPPLAVYDNPSRENLLNLLPKCNQFLVKDDGSVGEGIVLKNYDFVNRFGRTTWAKMITNEFKEKHHKEMGAPLMNGTELVEQKIVDEFCTEAFLSKERAKLELSEDGWTNKLIPRFFGVVFYELVREESWNILKKHKFPTIDFSLLNKLVINRCKKFLEV